MSSNNPDGHPEGNVIKKLDKVADTLENASTQLSNVVTQQQLDLVKDRVTSLETEIEKMRSMNSQHYQELTSLQVMFEKNLVAMERDYAGQRALSLSAFALSMLSLISLAVYSTLS